MSIYNITSLFAACTTLILSSGNAQAEISLEDFSEKYATVLGPQFSLMQALTDAQASQLNGVEAPQYMTAPLSHAVLQGHRNQENGRAVLEHMESGVNVEIGSPQSYWRLANAETTRQLFGTDYYLPAPPPPLQ